MPGNNGVGVGGVKPALRPAASGTLAGCRGPGRGSWLDSGDKGQGRVTRPLGL